MGKIVRSKYEDLSRCISHALRHEPWLYELELDDEGWVPVELLLKALRAERGEWETVALADIESMIDSFPKKRHELRDGMIRARYGHSISGKFQKTPAEPPEILYHGTSPLVLPSIKAGGLLPMGRQYVHLSTNEATAIEVGRRKATNPIVLIVDAAEASRDGTVFFLGNEHVWLANSVAPRFIRGFR